MLKVAGLLEPNKKKGKIKMNINSNWIELHQGKVKSIVNLKQIAEIDFTDVGLTIFFKNGEHTNFDNTYQEVINQLGLNQLRK